MKNWIRLFPPPNISQPARNRGNSIKIMIIFHLSGWFSRSSSSLSDPFSTSKPKISCRWALFTTWDFKIQAASYFPMSWIKKKNRLIFYLAKFYVWNWRILVFMRTRFNIDPYSPLKPTKVGFIFIESKIFQLSITWHTPSSKLGLKVGFKELRLEPKFLNCGLRKVYRCSELQVFNSKIFWF